MERENKNFVASAINFVLYIIRYTTLLFCVLYGCFAVGYLIVYLFRDGKSLDILYNVMGMFTNYTQDEILTLIDAKGTINVAVAGFGMGFIKTFNCFLLYVIVQNFQQLKTGIVSGTMFEKKYVDVVYRILPLSILYALVEPVITRIMIFSTGVFRVEDIRMSGFLLLVFVVVLRTVFTYGYERNKTAKKYEKVKNDLVAREEENNLEIINKDAQIKELKDELKALKEEIKVQEAKIETKVETKTTKAETKKSTKTENKRKYYKRPAKKNTK